MSTIISVDTTLQVNRLIKAPRERVFAAWTKSEELAKWFGPTTCRVLSAKLDVRVGGSYAIQVLSEMKNEIMVSGSYREVTPPSRLVFTWGMKGPPPHSFSDSLVTVDFHEVEGGTDVRITHERFPNLEMRDGHNYGWNGCFDKLAKALGVGECEEPKFAVGNFCWNELLTRDVSGSQKFYTQLFGWEAAPFPAPEMHYTLFKEGENQLAGMAQVPRPEIPPHWLSYVHVANVDASTRKAEELGGTIMAPAFDVPTVGRIAIITDPQGAALGLFQPLAK